MWLFNIILYSFIVLPFSFIYIKKYRFTPVSVFLLMEINYFYQICFAPKGKLDYVVRLETIYVAAMAFFIAGVLIASRMKFFRRNDCYGQKPAAGIRADFLDRDVTPVKKAVIFTIVAVSILLCIYLFAAGGVNVFLNSIKDFFRSETIVYKSERSEFFSVAGMGYIYQFRAILLPILSFYLVFCQKKKYSRVLGYGLMALMVIFLLGTGQRNAFMFYCLVILFYSWMMRKYYGIRTFGKAEFIILVFFGMLFMIVLTISNGRVEAGDDMIQGAVWSLFYRVFSVNPRTAITAFSYIDKQPCCWGYDWLMTLADILPGKSGYVTVSRIVYYLAYGTINGTGDPCIWGSAWYNFSIFGVTLFPLIMGICYHSVYKTMRRKREKNRLYMLIYSGLCVYLGIWVYGTPMNLFNLGVISLLILRWLLFSVVKDKQ